MRIVEILGDRILLSKNLVGELICHEIFSGHFIIFLIFTLNFISIPLVHN